MEVLELPFNRFVGLSNAPDESGYIFRLADKKEYSNHLGTVHASALFALAEATSGEFLLRALSDIPDNLFPVVRKVETKFRKPAEGEIYSNAEFTETAPETVKSEITTKGRALVKIQVTLHDKNGVTVMSSVFEWFLALAK